MVGPGSTSWAAPLHVLFVCRANLCRSPLAEHLLRAKLKAHQTRWTVRSAGIAARDGEPLLPATKMVLGEHGIEVARWQTSRLTPNLVRMADLVLTAEVEQRRGVVSMAPAAVARTFTLLEFARLLSLSGWSITADKSSTLADSLIAAAAAGRDRPQLRDTQATDISDPIRRPISELRETTKQIDRALEEILEAVEFG